jgi:hypothetical protein
MTSFIEILQNTSSVTARFGIPEFNIPKPNWVLSVSEGQCRDADRAVTFVSEGFESCSGLVLHNPLSKKCGLFHIFPGQDIYGQVTSLRCLADSMGILIDGSESTPKKRILADLKTLFAIQVARVITVDTNRPLPGVETETIYSNPFHIIYRPMTNEILVARISHQDVLTFPAFAQ